MLAPLAAFLCPRGSTSNTRMPAHAAVQDSLAIRKKETTSSLQAKTGAPGPSSKYWGPHCIIPPDVVMQCWSAALAPAQRDLQTTSHHTGLSRCSSCCAAQQRPSRWPPHSGQSGGAPQAAAGGGPLCGCRWQPRWGSETGWAAGAGRRCLAGTGIELQLRLDLGLEQQEGRRLEAGLLAPAYEQVRAVVALQGVSLDAGLEEVLGMQRQTQQSHRFSRQPGNSLWCGCHLRACMTAPWIQAPQAPI